MNKFLHIIVTTFNVKTKPGREWPNPDAWVAERLSILEKYTYPSIMAQTNKNFSWVIFYSEESLNTKFIDKIKELKNVDLFCVPGIQTFNAQKHLVQGYLKTKNIENYEYLITTTLDSDDMIRNTYVEDIQNKRFKEQNLKIINYRTGYRHFVGEEGTWEFKWSCNSLFTMIEKINKLEDIITCKQCYSHAEMCRKRYFKHVEDINNNKPMWIHLIHESNVQTKYKEGDRWERLIKNGKYIHLKNEEVSKKFGANIHF